MPKLLAIGYGYVAKALASRLSPKGWQVTGTSRSPASPEDIEVVKWEAGIPVPRNLVEVADAIVISVGPDETGCPVAQAMPAITFTDKPVLYLSSTGVYGDFQGDWIDETAPTEPTTRRGHNRLLAERQWQDWAATSGARLHLCRLAGVYGPGRSAIDRLLSDDPTPRVIKPGQVFNRIHVDDIAAGLDALLANDQAPTVINFTDDEPAPPQDVIECAAELLKRPLPPEVPFEKADMSPMARSFYTDNKRLKSDRLKALPGFQLQYPTYREGLAAIHAQHTSDSEKANGDSVNAGLPPKMGGMVAVIAQLPTILIAFIIDWFTDISLIAAMGPLWLAGVIGLGGAAILITHALFLRLALPVTSDKLDRQIDELFEKSGIKLSNLNILLISVMAGLSEELLFRGALQGWMALHLPMMLAIVIPAVLFAAMHPKSVSYVLYVLPIGLYLGVIYWLSGSLLGVIIAHALYDVFALWFARWRQNRTKAGLPKAI